MLDITKFSNSISLYGGSEVKKTYYINKKKYMVKFPDPNIKNNNFFLAITNTLNI